MKRFVNCLKRLMSRHEKHESRAAILSNPRSMISLRGKIQDSPASLRLLNDSCTLEIDCDGETHYGTWSRLGDWLMMKINSATLAGEISIGGRTLSGSVIKPDLDAHIPFHFVIL